MVIETLQELPTDANPVGKKETSYTQDISTESFSKQYNTKSAYELEEEARRHMAENGLPLDGPIIADGKFHRYSIDTKKNQPDESYIAFQGISAKGNQYLCVSYGTFSGGWEAFTYKSWKGDDNIQLSSEERAEMQKILENQKKEFEKRWKEHESRQIEKAKEYWESASETPNKAIQYLDRKKANGHGLRFRKRDYNDGTEKKPVYVKHDTAVIPLTCFEGNRFAIQDIRPDGVKRITGSKKGCFHLIGEITKERPILVVEGYSTGSSIHQALGLPVIVAVDCGNLSPVVESLVKKYPNHRTIICGDDDTETLNNKNKLCNPGRKHAEDAAKRHNCDACFPSFPEDFRLSDGKRPTDWNDLHVHFGLEEVSRQVGKILKKAKPASRHFSEAELKKALNDNEYGDVELFVKGSDDNLLFDRSSQGYYVWNGARWEEDIQAQRLEYIGGVADQYSLKGEGLLNECGDDKDLKEAAKAFLARARALKTKRRTNAVLDLAKCGQYGHRGLTYHADWDMCPSFLPCQNGLIDLKSGVLQPIKKTDFIKTFSPCKYDENAPCFAFEDFLADVMDGNQELVKFLQRLFGYIACGEPKEHKFVFLYGAAGRNGKGTLVRIICKAMGDLARTFSPELILMQRNAASSGNARPDLIRLQGNRLASFSEINEGRRIDSAILKNLSGGDTIAARALFSNDIKNFDPTHTIVLQANHKPKAPADDMALWRRAILVHFNVVFSENPSQPNEKLLDPEIELKLTQELSGILRWIVEGAVEYNKNGLLIPKEVSDAVDDYRMENDGIGEFLKERCKLIPEWSVRCSDLRDAIREFCQKEGFKTPTRNEIPAYLEAKGFQKIHMNDGWKWIGIKLVQLESAE